MTTLFEDRERRIHQLVLDEDKLFSIDEKGVVLWRGHPVAQLKKGEQNLSPDIQKLSSSDLGGSEDDIFDHENVQNRLKQFVRSWVDAQLGDIKKLEAACSDTEFKNKCGVYGQDVVGKLLQYLGIVFLERATQRPSESQIISQEEREYLRSLGIRIGRKHAWMSNALKPASILARVVLSNTWAGRTSEPLPETGRVSFIPLSSQSPAFLRQCGYRVVGTKAFRIDMLERLIGDIFRAARTANTAANTAANANTSALPRETRTFTPFKAPDAATSVIGSSNTEFADVMNWLGYELYSDSPGHQMEGAPQTETSQTKAIQDSQAEPSQEGAAPLSEKAQSAENSKDEAHSSQASEQKQLWTRKPKPQHSKRQNPAYKIDTSTTKNKSESHKSRSNKPPDNTKKHNKKHTSHRDSQNWKSHARDSRIIENDSPFAALASLKSKLPPK